mgnify:CR=1 FL=1
MHQVVHFEDLGIKSYQPTWDYQETLLLANTTIKYNAREKGIDMLDTTTKHHLLFVEHPPVFTLGHSSFLLEKVGTTLGVIRTLQGIWLPLQLDQSVGIFNIKW